jgi:hypothetical protein
MEREVAYDMAAIRSELHCSDVLLRIFVEEGVRGAFVFDFAQPYFPHAPDPAFDLDMAGYGLVKVLDAGSEGSPSRWERKEAFEVVARAYRAG